MTAHDPSPALLPPDDEREALAGLIVGALWVNRGGLPEIAEKVADLIIAAGFRRTRPSASAPGIGGQTAARIFKHAAARLLWHLCPVNTPVSFHEDWRKLHSVIGGDGTVKRMNADRPVDLPEPGTTKGKRKGKTNGR